MQYKASTPEEYLQQVPEERKAPLQRIRTAILEQLPEGFEETISYGMIGYVVPHGLYPDGYHCNPKLPLPFMNLASQKNYISLYHSGLYADSELLAWFTEAYGSLDIGKPDMGKCCVRFKKMDRIPYGLIGELAGRMTVEQWVDTYENAIKK